MEPRLLELMVCPLCKGPLEHWRPPQSARQELVCQADGLAFPVRDGIPVMLEGEARPLGPERVPTPAEAASSPSPLSPLPPPVPPASGA